MLKTIKKHSLLIPAISILLVVLLSLTIKVSYYLGERHVTDLVLHSSTIPDGKLDYPPPNYNESIKQLQSKLNQISNDYDSVCYRYQELYSAYDVIYTQFGAASGQAKVVRPDSASGNEESCYR